MAWKYRTADNLKWTQFICDEKQNKDNISRVYRERRYKCGADQVSEPFSIYPPRSSILNLKGYTEF